MCCIGTIGKCGLVDTEVAFNQQINAIEADEKIIDNKFLLYACMSDMFQFHAISRSSSTTLPILNKKKWGELPLPLPPLAEQRRIVARLEELLPHVDAIAGLR